MKNINKTEKSISPAISLCSAGGKFIVSGHEDGSIAVCNEQGMLIVKKKLCNAPIKLLLEEPSEESRFFFTKNKKRFVVTAAPQNGKDGPYKIMVSSNRGDIISANIHSGHFELFPSESTLPINYRPEVIQEASAIARSEV